MSFGINNRRIKRVLSFVYARFPDYILNSVKRAMIACRSRILDVDSGRGTMENMLKPLGYQNVLGIDPFNGKKTFYIQMA
jgi:2-polyprenyl-3-methyl-5-hydroxy-6-metoxy-1,4-benzoquinol methylase